MTERSSGRRRSGDGPVSLSPDGDLPLSRPVAVVELPARGLDVTVTPDEAERKALAQSLGLASIESLAGTFHLTRKGRVVHVEGEVVGEVHQICVVTLDPFPASVREPVEVRFSDDVEPPEHAEIELTEAALDAPEPIVGNRIDLGALTGEFLALGLDPYPRKPGAAFAFEDPGEEEPSPFAALARLKDRPE